MPPQVADGWITLPVAAIQVADDDGGRQAEVVLDDVGNWIGEANRTYAAAKIRFTFNPKDTTTVNSTLLNNMMGTSDATWEKAKAEGNQAAKMFPGRVLLIVRHGPGDVPCGGGFTWTDYNFIAMSRAGSSTPNVLAHESGHFLGLAHTFGREFPDTDAMAGFLASQPFTPYMFDGDWLPDTASTPFVKSLVAQSSGSFSCGGRTFNIDEANIMSFYARPAGMTRNTLTPQQIERVRWVATARLKNAMVMPNNLTSFPKVECESLPMRFMKKCSGAAQQMAGFGRNWFSGDAQITCKGGVGDGVALTISAEKAGRYRLEAYWTFAPDYGIVSVDVNGTAVGQTMNLYGPSVAPTGPIDHGTCDIRAGKNELIIKVVDPRMGVRDGSRCQFGIDALRLVPLDSAGVPGQLDRP